MGTAQLLQMTVNGLVLGLTTLLIALAFQFQLGVMRVLVFNLGEFYMLGAFIVWLAMTNLGWSYWVSVPVAMAIVSVIGILQERYLLRRYRGWLIPQVVITLGLMFIMQTSVLVGVGTEPKRITTVFEGVTTMAGAALSNDRIAAGLISIAFLVASLLFWQYTKVGKTMRAVSQEPEGAVLQGVNLGGTYRWTMIVSCCSAALAGALLGPIFTISPNMGGHPMILGMIVITIAGMGSVGGTVIAAIVLGLLQGYLLSMFGSAPAMLAFFVALIVVLLVKPTGLWGQELHIE